MAVPMPVNVRVALPNGTEIPVELRYRGRDDDGTHMWEQIHPGPFPLSMFADGNHVLVDELPVMCGISIDVDEDL